MITSLEAIKLLSKNCIQLQKGPIDIELLKDCVLREDLVADRDYPPFNRVAMDGIGINYSSLENCNLSFKVCGIQKAGSPQLTLNDKLDCIEVMTGSSLPVGCDTVIRYEDIEIKDGLAIISPEAKIVQKQNIHFKGTDYQEGSILLKASVKMRTPEWSIAASVGKKSLEITKIPKIAIISTGDELVDIDCTPLPHQIRRSNCYSILSSLKANDYDDNKLFHLNDNPDELKFAISEIMKDFDVLIMSGGVSMGKFDFTPKVLNELNVKEVFHKIKQKPGKPMWFGRNDKNAVFGLPGNPVSAITCLHKYVLPYLQKISKQAPRRVLNAILTKEITFKQNMTYFKHVKVDCDNEGKLIATPIIQNGSGDFASLTKSDGFLELPADKNTFNAGEVYPLILWREF